MYLHKLPGHRYFSLLSALIIVFLGITFNGIMNFSQYMHQASSQFTHSMVLVDSSKKTDQEVKESLRKIPHLESFNVYKRNMDMIYLYVDIKDAPEDVENDIAKMTDFSLKELKRLTPFIQTFLGFMRAFLVLVVGFLIMLILVVTRYFMAYNRETLKTMILLGATKSTLSKKLQWHFLKQYFIGGMSGLLILFLGFVFLNYSHFSFQFLKSVFKDSSFIITFLIVPCIVLIVSLASSMVVVYNQLYKIR